MDREEVIEIIRKAREEGEIPDLHGADLYAVDLSGVDLRKSNLTRANLSCCVLYGAELSDAKLDGIDLRWSDLRGATGSFSIFGAGKHTAIAAGGYISIGCERHTYKHWLKHYIKIGEVNGYTEAEIERYGKWIKDAVKWLGEDEQ